MTAARVPNLPNPTMPLCWQQGPLLDRCDRARGHSGRHTWEMAGRTCATCRHKANLNARHYCMKHKSYCTVLGKTCGAWAAWEEMGKR